MRSSRSGFRGQTKEGLCKTPTFTLLSRGAHETCHECSPRGDDTDTCCRKTDETTAPQKQLYYWNLSKRSGILPMLLGIDIDYGIYIVHCVYTKGRQMCTGLFKTLAPRFGASS